MRTTLAEDAFDRRATEEPVLARNHPRRRSEPPNEREDGHRHGNRTNRSPLRHGVQHIRDDLRRIG